MQDKIHLNTESPRLDQDQQTDRNWCDTDQISTHNAVDNYSDN